MFVYVCFMFVWQLVLWIDLTEGLYIYIRRVLKCAFTYDLSLTVLRWLNYYYYYPPCVSAIPGDPRGKTPMHWWQFCGQRLHPQRYCHWNTGCKYMTEGPVVNHSFILPTVSHLWNTGCQKSRCQSHLYWLMMMMNWCLMSSDVMRHIRDKLWPMPKHGAINLYVHGNQKAR